MEDVTPPRESGRFSERYIWDRRGDNEKTAAAVAPLSRRSSSAKTSSRLQSSHRQTVHWPFLQNLVITETSDVESETSSIRPLTSSYPRRATWQPGKRNSSASLLDLVPDYIVNYLRGETPESLARKREKKNIPDPEQIANELRSRFGPDGFSDTDSAHERPRTGGSQEDTQQMLPDGDAEEKMDMQKLLKGWRGGIVVNSLLAGVVVLATVVAFVIAIATERNGETRIFDGPCSESQMVSFGIHIATSILSMLLLVASNYGFQVLTSPTRVEVDMAHDARKWLDIGVPSLRNLRSITSTRAILACMLLGAAVAVQAIYNSVIFTKQHAAAPDGSLSCAVDSYDVSLGVTILLSFVILICIGSLLGLKGFNPLVTLGDSIASFLTKPDHTTRGACLLTKAEAIAGAYAPGESRVYTPQKHAWFQTPSRRRWLVWVVSWVVPAAPTGFLIANALTRGVPLTSLFDSFSISPAEAALLRLGFTSNHAAPIFLAGLPQLLIALLYLTTNSLLTTYSLSHELSRFANPGASYSLRVSFPGTQGHQTNSLYLTLPRPYSWLLFAIFMPLSLFLSFSFRPLVIGSADSTSEQLAIFIDTTSLLVAAALLLAVLGLVLILSLRRVDAKAATLEDGSPAGNPLILKGGSCSAVISARSHRLASDRDAAQGLLSWGVIRENTASEAGVAGFSTMGTEMLCPGKEYA